MSIDQPTALGALSRLARVLVGGGELDAKLGSIAGEVAGASGAAMCLLYLVDGQSRMLIPVASHGVPQDVLEDQVADASATGEITAQVVHERRPMTASGTDPGAARLARLGTGLTWFIALPLVNQDEQGTDEVEGVLALGFQATPPVDATDPFLEAAADLAASAIRTTRLERALVERADWYDRMAHLDPLTGLANRRTFERALELEIARAGRGKTLLTIAVFRISGRDAIMTSLGGEAADDVLRVVAAAMAEAVRVLDTVARVGSDEFGLICPGSAGGTVVERIRAAVDAAPIPDGVEVALEVGSASYPEEGASSSELISAAYERIGSPTALPGPSGRSSQT